MANETPASSTLEQTKTSPQQERPQRATRPVYLDDPRLDKMLNAIIELTAQLYISRDRARAMEHLLIEKGVLTAGELDKFKGEETLEAELTKEREALVAAVITRHFFED